MSKLARSILFLSTLAAASALAPALAETIKYKADLTSANEVPPNDTGAKGTIEATYDSDAGTLSWSGSYSGLSGPAIAAHFHGPAAAGVNAPVLVPVDAEQEPVRRLGQDHRRRRPRTSPTAWSISTSIPPRTKAARPAASWRRNSALQRRRAHSHNAHCRRHGAAGAKGAAPARPPTLEIEPRRRQRREGGRERGRQRGETRLGFVEARFGRVGEFGKRRAQAFAAAPARACGQRDAVAFDQRARRQHRPAPP